MFVFGKEISPLNAVWRTRNLIKVEAVFNTALWDLSTINNVEGKWRVMQVAVFESHVVWYRMAWTTWQKREHFFFVCHFLGPIQLLWSRFFANISSVSFAQIAQDHTFVFNAEVTYQHLPALYNDILSPWHGVTPFQRREKNIREDRLFLYIVWFYFFHKSPLQRNVFYFFKIFIY